MNALVEMPLVGEIIGPGDTVDVVVALNIFSLSSQVVKVPAGSTLAECVAAAEAEYKGPRAAGVVVSIGDQIVRPEWWNRVRVKRGTFVAVRGAPGKDTSILRNILLLAVAVAALAINPVLGGGLIGALAGGAVAIGGAYLVGKLFPLRPPVLDHKSASRTYSISGGSNSADPYGPIPFILGTNRCYPKIGARYYTEFDGADQYFHGLYVWGYGAVDISDIKIGETPIAQFDGVTIQTIPGYVGGSAITQFPKDVIEDSLSIELKQVDGWSNRTTATDITEIQVDLVAPSGIYVVNNSTGDKEKRDVSIRVEYAAVGSTLWKLLGTLDVSAKSTDAIRKTVKLAGLTAGQYQVRVEKTTKDHDGENRQQSDTFYWTALRGVRAGNPILFNKPLAITALRIKATGQLSGTIDSLNAIVKSKSYAFTGSPAAWTADQISNNPADLFRYVLQGPFNPRPVDDEQIDFDTLEAWHAVCVTKGWTFNMVRDFRARIWDCLADVCAAGRAVPCFKDGKWSLTWDDPDAPIVGHYTARNSRGFTGERSYVRAPHAYRVRFINEDQGYAQDELAVYDDGYTSANATLFEVIEFPGVTDPDLIWKFGRYHIAQARLRPETYTLIVAREHFRNTVGDRVYVSHYLPIFGLTQGRVKAVDDPTITLDEPIVMESGKAYGIRFQDSAGDTLQRTVVNVPGGWDSVDVSGSGSLPSVGDLFMFGEVDEEAVVLRIKKITHVDEAEARLTLVDDAPDIHLADTGTIPAFDSHITLPADPFGLPPYNLAAVEGLRVVEGRLISDVQFSWETIAGGGAASFEIQKRDDAADLIWKAAGTAGGTTKTFIVVDLTRGIWSFRVRSLFADGTSSGWVTLTGFTVAGAPDVPSDVATLAVKTDGKTAVASFTPVQEVGVSHYEIRHSPALDASANWGTAVTVATVAAQQFQTIGAAAAASYADLSALAAAGLAALQGLLAASTATLQGALAAATVQLTALQGTFLIKAVNFAGIESVNATTFVNLVDPILELNVDETFEPAPTWDGDKTYVEVEDGSLRLVEAPGILDFPEILDWQSLIWTTNFPWIAGVWVADDRIDLGEVLKSRIHAVINAFGDNTANVIGGWGPVGGVGLIAGGNADKWRVRLDYRYTVDDPDAVSPDPVWSEWTELVPSDVAARAFEFRMFLFSFAPYITPVVDSLVVTIDMEDGIRSDSNLTCPDTGLRVDFDPPFRVFEGLAITAQNNVSQIVREITTDEDETGFTIAFYNILGGVNVETTFSYVAKGYGTRISA